MVSWRRKRRELGDPLGDVVDCRIHARLVIDDAARHVCETRVHDVGDRRHHAAELIEALPKSRLRICSSRFWTCVRRRGSQLLVLLALDEPARQTALTCRDTLSHAVEAVGRLCSLRAMRQRTTQTSGSCPSTQ